MKTGLPKEAAAWCAMIGLALYLPDIASPYLMHLLTLALIFGIFALGYDILLGHTGIVSFGHSIFFGVPAYAIGMIGASTLNITNPIFLFFVAVSCGLLLGAAVGWIASVSRGIYLAIVTFAVAQIVALVVMSDPGGLTSGENGMVGVRPSDVAVFGMHLDLFSGAGLYYMALAWLVTVYLATHLLTRSQWGHVFHAIRENEGRLSSLGFNTRPYKILAFSLSAGVSAIAGSMAALLNNTVSPEMVQWQLSAEILLITILGGSGTRNGPLLGAFAVIFAQAVSSSLLGGGNWVYVLGGLYIAVALLPPGGIMSLLSRIRWRWPRAAVLRADNVRVNL